MKRQFITFLLIALVVGGVYLAWQAAAPQLGAPDPSLAKNNNSTPNSGAASANLQKAKPVAANGWVPPEGDPVEKYKLGKTAEERHDIIQNFLTLGHPNNRFMLIAALNDSDAKVRFSAVESASFLTPDEAREVYARAGLSDDSEVRQMCWSLAAPHPIENRAIIYGEVLERGGNTQLEEALSEMGRTPEKPLFDMMLTKAFQSKEPERAARLMKELQQWLVPGGGPDVPQFKTPQELVTWWTAHTRNYDQFLLRTDL